MNRILHLSDLHFGPPCLAPVAEAVLRIAPTLEPDVIVVSGDFTQRAKRRQFEEARAFLDRLPKTTIVTTPGNHDVPLYRVAERLRDPYGLYKEYIAEELDNAWILDGLAIVSVNSTAPERALVNGRIHAKQLDFCADAFANAPDDCLRIVVSHHHFAPAPDYAGGQVMPQAKRAMARFQALEVDLVLGGHLHRAYIGNSLDVYPGIHRDRGVIIVQCGTTTSRRGKAREREKNSFNLIEADDHKIQVTHYMYFDETDFAPMSRHVFPRPGHKYFRGRMMDTPPTNADVAR